MKQEKNNSSLQQRDLEISKEEIENKEKEKRPLQNLGEMV